MRILSATLLLLTLLLTTGCPDAGDPQSVAQQAKLSIAPYFPNVKAFALPDQDMIIAYTCTQGTGDALTETVRDTLPNIQGISKLKDLRTFGWISRSHTYGRLALAFERSMVVYNIDSGEFTAVEDLDNGYVAEYERVCEIDNGHSGQIAYIGVWRVTYTYKGNRRNSVWYDTLGAYKTQADFERNREAELSARTPFIYKDAATKGWQDVNITLVAVNAMPVGSQYLAH